MEPGTGTFVAAIIAAGSSVVSLATNTFASRRAEMRTAHRQQLGPTLEQLAKGQHEILATSNIIRKRLLQNQDISEWTEKGKAAKECLSEARLRVRYPLWGLDESFRTLTRLPEWMATVRNLEDGHAEALLARASRLAARTDQVIRRSYKRGLPPNGRERWLADRRVKRVRKTWDRRYEAPLRWWDLPQRLRIWRAPRPAVEIPETEVPVT
jgi:hypothetical protein